MKRACSWLLPSDYELYTSKGFQVFRLGFSNPAHEYGVRQARLLCYSIAMPEERKMLILTGARHDIGCAAHMIRGRVGLSHRNGLPSAGKAGRSPASAH